MNNGHKHGATDRYYKELFADHKNSASECNESSLSNCRAQPILSKSLYSLPADDISAGTGLLSTVYDQFPIRLKIVCNLSKRDYQMCLLIKIKMRPQEIANIFSIEKSSVSSQRARLYKDHFGEKKKAKAWDEYILSL